jgi:hypothetical protein
MSSGYTFSNRTEHVLNFLQRKFTYGAERLADVQAKIGTGKCVPLAEYSKPILALDALKLPYHSGVVHLAISGAFV